MEGQLLFFAISRYADVIAPLIAIVIALFRSYSFGRLRAVHFTEQCLQQFLLWVVGIESLLVFALHAWYPNITAAMAGWPAASLSYDIALFNLCFGILGLLATFSSLGFRVATCLGYSIWIFGTGLNHVINMLSGTSDMRSVGFVLYTDLATPIILMILMMTVYQTQKSNS